MQIIETVLALALTLGILVTIHEFANYTGIDTDLINEFID